MIARCTRCIGGRALLTLTEDGLLLVCVACGHVLGSAPQAAAAVPRGRHQARLHAGPIRRMTGPVAPVVLGGDRCDHCGGWTGRRRRKEQRVFCSLDCNQAAYEARRKAARVG